VRWRCIGEQRYSSIILDLGSRYRWVISFTAQPFYPRGQITRYQKLGGPQSRSEGCVSTEKSPASARNRNPAVQPAARRYTERDTHSLTAVTTTGDGWLAARQHAPSRIKLISIHLLSLLLLNAPSRAFTASCDESKVFPSRLGVQHACAWCWVICPYSLCGMIYPQTMNYMRKKRERQQVISYQLSGFIPTKWNGVTE
jgi:hypothetical protein